MVSIVVPVRNEAGNVCHVVGSAAAVLVKQGITDYEVIFVDDGGTDDTAQAVRDEKSRIENENVAGVPQDTLHFFLSQFWP